MTYHFLYLTIMDYRRLFSACLRTNCLFLIPYATLTIFLFVYLHNNSTFNPENNHTNTKIIFEDKYVNFYGSMLIAGFVIRGVLMIIMTIIMLELEYTSIYDNDDDMEYKSIIMVNIYITISMTVDIILSGWTVIGIRENDITPLIYKYYAIIECITLFWPVVVFIWYQIYKLFGDCFKLCGLDNKCLLECSNFMCCQYKKENKKTSTVTYGSIKKSNMV